MKVKNIKISVEDVKNVSNGIVQNGTLKEVENAGNDKKLSFENIKEFRKAITPKRIELLHMTRKMKPKSLNELARLLFRDVKSISIDIQLLGKLGLINLEKKTDGRKEIVPIVDYSKINLEIVV